MLGLAATIQRPCPGASLDLCRTYETRADRDEIVATLAEPSQIDLATVEVYERKHDDRSTIRTRISALRGDEPWAGYDELTAAEIVAKLPSCRRSIWPRSTPTSVRMTTARPSGPKSAPCGATSPGRATTSSPSMRSAWPLAKLTMGSARAPWASTSRRTRTAPASWTPSSRSTPTRRPSRTGRRSPRDASRLAPARRHSTVRGGGEGLERRNDRTCRAHRGTYGWACRWSGASVERHRVAGEVVSATGLAPPARDALGRTGAGHIRRYRDWSIANTPKATKPSAAAVSRNLPNGCARIVCIAPSSPCFCRSKVSVA
jgi:hypothetical protein